MTSPFEAGSGTCYRCEQPGHWQDDPACPLNSPAASRKEHWARLDRFKARFLEFEITAYQKTAFIQAENKLDEKRKAKEKRSA